MTTEPLDTTAEAAAVQRGIWRTMTGEKRMRLSLGWSSWVRRVALDGVRKRHPEYDERMLKLAWLRKTMGDDAYSELFPGEPVEC